MNQQNRGFLIDPEKQTITEVMVDHDFRAIYPVLGAGVDDFNIVYIDEQNIVYVDGEGLLKDPEFFFLLSNYPQPLPGRGLVLGSHGDETCDVNMTMDELRAMVTFDRLKLEGWKNIDKIVDHPHLGKVRMIGASPVFSKRKTSDVG